MDSKNACSPANVSMGRFIADCHISRTALLDFIPACLEALAFISLSLIA